MGRLKTFLKYIVFNHMKYTPAIKPNVLKDLTIRCASLPARAYISEKHMECASSNDILPNITLLIAMAGTFFNTRSCRDKCTIYPTKNSVVLKGTPRGPIFRFSDEVMCGYSLFTPGAQGTSPLWHHFCFSYVSLILDFLFFILDTS
jgi:hypothetical protein